MVARITRDLLVRCEQLNAQISGLDTELRDLVRELAPSLLAIPGCGVLSAAVIRLITNEGVAGCDRGRRVGTGVGVEVFR